MADPDKIPETQDDTQATYDPTVQEDNELSQTINSSMLSESQDFKLVDCEETQNLSHNETQNEIQAIKSKDRAEGGPQGCVDSENVSSTQPEQEIEPKSPTDRLSIDETKDDTEDKKVGKSDDKELSDDDDDFIQSSQQESVSPLKRQLSNLLGGVSQKRKADTFDDTVAKFPRTCLHQDALSNVRKKLEDAEVFVTESIKDTMEDDVISNLIIQETQESCETEKTSESLQQVEQELEEALSQHATDEDYSKNDDIGTRLKSSPIKLSPVIEKLVEEKEQSLEAEKIADKEKTPEKEDTSEEKKSPEPEATQPKEKSPEKEIATTEKSKCDDVSVPDISTVTRASEKLEQDSNSTDKAVTEKVAELIKVPAQSTSTIMEDTKDEATNYPIMDHAISKSNDCGIALKDTEAQKLEVEKPVTSATTTNRSRMSIEVIYDRATAPPEKKLPRELVEIDEDGEKIVLDSSHEGCDRSTDKNKIDTSYKTCDSKASTDYKSVDSSKESSCDYKSGYSLTNGSTDSKIADTDSAAGVTAGFFTSDSTEKRSANLSQSPNKKMRMTVMSSKKVDENPEILSISDSDESFLDERSKIKEQTPVTNIHHDNSSTKFSSIEKELSIIVKLKCLVYVDEVTKEQVEKVVTGVHCEPMANDLSLSRRRNSDTSGLADISGNDNRDASPGSVTSNRHPYPLNARLSLASIASSSSSSSAGSIAKHIGNNTNKFQLPRGPAKHAKKVVTESASTPKKLENTELLEHIKKEWKNVDTVTTTLMTFASNELQTMDLHNGSTAERVVDNSLERIRSSTPEVVEKLEIVQEATPKRTAKRGRNSKASRSKSLRSSDSNGVPKSSPLTPAIIDVNKITPSTGRKRKSVPDPSTPSRQNTTAKEPVNDSTDDLVGKEVFAKWSDNKYYPGTVTGKTKTKLRVNFYDGQNKMIIEDFVVPMPPTLNPGLSVYATTNEDDYGSCGIIIDVKKSKDNVIYIVETDEREKVRVDIKNIFLTNDQVQVLKEETKVQLKSPPSTPKHLGKVSLDNVIDGKRRSKRVVTPVVTTPRGKRGRGSLVDKNIDPAKPSASGTSSGIKYEENYDTTSDSNHSTTDDCDLMGVQPEIMGAVSEQDTKGPSSGIKGKGRSRKRSEDPEVVASLGPIPSANSDIFRGMSFILTCVSLDIVERYQAESAKDSGSDPGTENEEEWSRKPFVRERLVAQITAGGGKIYENFELIPSEEYVNTKLIANVPNITKKALLCLSVGIKAYNHQWIIRCCKENKIVNPSEEELPAGWSLLKNSYVEMFQRRNEKPFQTLPVIVVMPVTPADKEFISFWRQICENAGGAVLPVESPDDGFIEGTVVLTNKRCPSWVIEKASSWNIPLVSTTWIVECLIEGNICSCDAHPSFKYNYVKRSSSHISHLKRR